MAESKIFNSLLIFLENNSIEGWNVKRFNMPIAKVCGSGNTSQVLVSSSSHLFMHKSLPLPALCPPQGHNLHNLSHNLSHNLFVTNLLVLNSVPIFMVLDYLCAFILLAKKYLWSSICDMVVLMFQCNLLLVC